MRKTMKQEYMPTRCIYSLLSQDKLPQMVKLHNYYTQRDSHIDKIYKDIAIQNPKNRDLKLIYQSMKSREGKKSKIVKDKYIEMIQNQELNELMQELVDKNVDLSEPIEKQGSDFKYYSYFLLAIHSLFHNISYMDAVTFINNVKREFKVKSQRKSLKSYVSGMILANLHSDNIMFSAKDSKQGKIIDSVQNLLSQILLLNFLEDYHSLHKLFLNHKTTETNRIIIYMLASQKYAKVSTKVSQTFKPKKRAKWERYFNELKRFLHDPKVVSHPVFQLKDVNCLLHCQISPKGFKLALRQTYLKKYVNEMTAILQDTDNAILHNLGF